MCCSFYRKLPIHRSDIKSYQCMPTSFPVTAVKVDYKTNVFSSWASIYGKICQKCKIMCPIDWTNHCIKTATHSLRLILQLLWNEKITVDVHNLNSNQTEKNCSGQEMKSHFELVGQDNLTYITIVERRLS